MQSRRAERYARRNQVECGFRVAEGEQSGLTTNWRHGVATLGKKEIVFVGTVGGVRFLKRSPTRFAVEHIDPSATRRPEGFEHFTIHPDTNVIRIKTPTATLECAFVGDQVQWIVDKIS